MSKRNRKKGSKTMYAYDTGLPKGQEAKRGYQPARRVWSEQRGRSSN